jgi:hypothetical protein
MRRWFVWMSVLSALASLGAAAPQDAQPPVSKPFIEANSDELTRAVPELSGMQFDSGPNACQDRLDALLAATGEDLADMFAELADVEATEQVHEMRFQDGAGGARRHE